MSTDLHPSILRNCSLRLHSIFQKDRGLVNLTPSRASLISPTYSGYSAFAFGRILVSKHRESSYNFTFNMHILSPIGIPPLTQLPSCRLTSVRRLNQFFTPLLGRTRPRGRSWAAIRLSHRPEPSGRVVHEEVGG